MQLARIFSVIHLTKVSTSNPNEEKESLKHWGAHVRSRCRYLSRSGTSSVQGVQSATSGTSALWSSDTLGALRRHRPCPTPQTLGFSHPLGAEAFACRQLPQRTFSYLFLPLHPSFRSKPVRTHLIMQHESLHLNSHELGFHFKVSNFFCWTDFKDNIFKPVETQHHTGELHVFR